MITGITVGICIMVIILSWNWYDAQYGVVAFFVLCGVGMYSCSNSDSWKANEKRIAEQEAREAQPHVIREYDGCKVYAFKTDRVHYYTKCGLTTTTESSRSVSCGKNCSKTEVETIVTENK